MSKGPRGVEVRAGTQGRRDAGTQNREFPLFNLSRSEERDTGESPDAAPRASLCPCLRWDGLRPKPPPKRPTELDCPLSLARTPPNLRWQFSAQARAHRLRRPSADTHTSAG